MTDRLFAAIESGDRDAMADLYADDIQIWHSATGQTVDRATGLAILDWLMAPGVTLSYEPLEQLVVGNRMSRRHILEVGIPGYPPMLLPASIYFTISDGQIHQIDEYVDAKATDELIARIPLGR